MLHVVLITDIKLAVGVIGLVGFVSQDPECTSKRLISTPLF